VRRRLTGAGELRRGWQFQACTGTYIWPAAPCGRRTALDLDGNAATIASTITMSVTSSNTNNFQIVLARR